MARTAAIIGDRWSLLILRELATGPLRFKSLKNRIHGISMDQLTKKLEHLCESGMIVRQEFSESPPRVEYQLTETGKSFVPVLRRILLWSFQYLWSKPEVDEAVDIGLTLRTMASFTGSGEGVIEVVIRKQGEVTSYKIERRADGSALESALLADAVIELSYYDWMRLVSASPAAGQVEVFGRISGRAEIARRILPVLERAKFTERELPRTISGRGPDLSL